MIGAQPVHSAYGYGDSYSALLIRIPDKKVSFILLCNSGAASSPFFLGYGNLLTSPFAVSFLREALPGAIQDDPRLLIGAPLLLAVLALLACYFPAQRGVKIDPIQALRQD